MDSMAELVCPSILDDGAVLFDVLVAVSDVDRADIVRGSFGRHTFAARRASGSVERGG